MKTLCGTLFVYNGITHDYCFVESIKNLKEFCDHVIVVDAGSTDGTIDAIKPLLSDKCQLVISDTWNETQGMGSTKLNHFTNIAIEYAEARGFDYNFNLQADEIVHEDSFQWIRKAMEEDREGYMVRRYNLWKDPYHMLNVEQARKPCSTEIVRLAKCNYRSVGDAESLGVPSVYIDYLNKIEVYHMGFVRKRDVMVNKVKHMQMTVFEMADYDRRLDKAPEFDPMEYFKSEDIIPIHKPLPKVIQEWAAERA
jgi:glycosyltransferase involved in cell wall biosynthesis